MKRLLLIFVTLLCLPAFTEPVQACQCREHGTPICAQFWRSDAVFVGQVVDIKPLKKRRDSPYEYEVAHFVVQESFRGVPGAKVSVATVTNSPCVPRFKKGKRYLVYAGFGEGTNQLFSGMCIGTTSAIDDETLKELRKLSKDEGEHSISGRIVRRRYEGLPGITVEVTGVDKTYKTLTTKYGEFSISLPSSGTFVVRVSVPYAVRYMYHSTDEVHVSSNQTDSHSTFTYDVVLEKGQCSYLEIDVDGTDHRATAIIAGNVLDATGQAVNKGSVDLSNAVDSGPDYNAKLEKDGSFKFERVAPGDYYLVLNARNEVPERFDAPYAPSYYPATEDKSKAIKIHVTEGATIENLAMRVGQRLSERRAAGRVAWKGGRELRFPYLKVYSGDKYVLRIETKDDGTFDVILYGDFDYSIEAWDDDDEEEIKGVSQRVPIPPGNTSALKLVIKRIKE